MEPCPAQIWRDVHVHGHDVKVQLEAKVFRERLHSG